VRRRAAIRDRSLFWRELPSRSTRTLETRLLLNRRHAASPGRRRLEAPYFLLMALPSFLRTVRPRGQPEALRTKAPSAVNGKPVSDAHDVSHGDGLPGVPQAIRDVLTPSVP